MAKKTKSKTPKVKDIKPKNVTPLASTPKSRITDRVELQDITAEYSKTYGSYVVEDRAIPDFRDGLKPVHRAALWAMYSMRIHNNGPFKKAARIVGEVIGKYHPHGDSAAYGAIVTIANNCMPNMIEGQGNWGSHVDNAAAPRYTECRLSMFSDMFLLDKTYLSVVPMVDNFDGTERMPLFLPATLPVQLICGSPTMPAYGVSAGTPSMHIEGVAKLVEASLRGKTLSAKTCAKYAKVHFRYGGELISEHEEVVSLMATGKGSLRFQADFDFNEKGDEMHIYSCAPGFSSQTSIDKTLEKIANIPVVGSISDRGDSNAGKYGINYTIKFKRASETQIDDAVDKIERYISGSANWHIGYTHARKEETRFGRCNVPEFLEMWTKYRISLEKAVIKHLVKEEQKKLDRQALLMWGANHIDDIAAALKDRKNGPHKHLAKLWKEKSAEFIDEILKLQVYRLASLEIADIKSKMKEHKDEIVFLKKDLKDPAARILRDFRTKVNKYIKDTRKLNGAKKRRGDRIE